jgi:hypothetical protein
MPIVDLAEWDEREMREAAEVVFEHDPESLAWLMALYQAMLPQEPEGPLN